MAEKYSTAIHMPYLILRDLIFQEQSSFAKDCRQRGGFFKCCVSGVTLHIFEDSRNRLIKEGLIKDKPTSWCMPSVKRKDPCVPCFSDAMCTERDIETGKIKHTFIKEKKKEHGVIWYFTSLFAYLIFVMNAVNVVRVKFLAECKKIQKNQKNSCFFFWQFCRKFTHFFRV